MPFGFFLQPVSRAFIVCARHWRCPGATGNRPTTPNHVSFIDGMLLALLLPWYACLCGIYLHQPVLMVYALVNAADRFVPLDPTQTHVY